MFAYHQMNSTVMSFACWFRDVLSKFSTQTQFADPASIMSKFAAPSL